MFAEPLPLLDDVLDHMNVADLHQLTEACDSGELSRAQLSPALCKEGIGINEQVLTEYRDFLSHSDEKPNLFEYLTSEDECCLPDDTVVLVDTELGEDGAEPTIVVITRQATKRDICAHVPLCVFATSNRKDGKNKGKRGSRRKGKASQNEDKDKDKDGKIDISVTELLFKGFLFLCVIAIPNLWLP